MKRLLFLVSLFAALAHANSYSTKFPATESPISQGGMWINGGTAGLDWSNVQTTPGFVGGVGPAAGPSFVDPTAVLTGVWRPNQSATATVFTRATVGNFFPEIELHLNSTMTAHDSTGDLLPEI